MSRLAHALLCDTCSDPVEPDDEPIVVPGPGPEPRHYHRDPDCAPPSLELEEANRGR